MSIDGVFYDKRLQNSKSYGKLFNASYVDGILNGCALTFNSSSITVGVGNFMVAGRLTQITAAETTTLLSPISSGYVRLKYVVDLTATASKDTFTQGYFDYDYSATLGGFAALTQEDINALGTTYNTYEVEFAIYTLSGNNITALTRSLRTFNMVIAPTFENSWVDYGSGISTAGFWIDTTGTVHLNGCVRSGSATTIFTLPYGYRPINSIAFIILSNALAASLTITPAGVVMTSGNNASVWLEGVNFTTVA